MDQDPAIAFQGDFWLENNFVEWNNMIEISPLAIATGDASKKDKRKFTTVHKCLQRYALRIYATFFASSRLKKDFRIIEKNFCQNFTRKKM